MALVLGLNQRSCFMGWALLPVHYTFNIENALSRDGLEVHCSSNTKEGDLGMEHAPLHGNYVHQFKSGLVTTVSYDCTRSPLEIERSRFCKFSLMHRSSLTNNVWEDTAFGRCKMMVFTCIRSTKVSTSRGTPGIMSRQLGYHSCHGFSTVPI